MTMGHIVHIGYHKTATSWFQKSFYPQVRNYRFVSRKDVRRAILLDYAFHFEPERALQRLGVDGELPLILCEEGLSGHLYSAGLYGFLAKEVACRLQATLPDANIVIFIRRQPEMIAAVYKQYVREGGTHTPRRFLYPERYLHETGFRPVYVPLFSFNHFEYYPLIKHYRQLFGEERVQVFLYEEFAANQQLFIDKYIRRFDLSVDMAQVSAASKVNESYRQGILPLARLANRFSRRNVMDKNYLVDLPGAYRLGVTVLKRLNRLAIFGRSPDPMTLFGEQLVGDLADRYRTWNRKLVEDLGLPLEKYGYPL